MINEMTNTPIDTTNPISTNRHPVVGKRNGHQPEAIAGRNQSKHADQPSDLQKQFGFHNSRNCFINLWPFGERVIAWRF